MKISTKKLREYIADEKQSSKDYRRYGFPRIAKDEARHSRILQRELNKRRK